MRIINPAPVSTAQLETCNPHCCCVSSPLNTSHLRAALQKPKAAKIRTGHVLAVLEALDEGAVSIPLAMLLSPNTSTNLAAHVTLSYAFTTLARC